MDTTQVAGLFAYLASAWPNTAVGETQIDIWAEQLAHVDPADARSAAATVVASSKWFPTVAEFLEHVQAARTARLARETPPALVEGRLPAPQRREAAQAGIRAAREALRR